MKGKRGIPNVIRNVLAKVLPNVDGFAMDVGVSRATLYYWGNGQRNPTPANLTRLADALERRSEDLAGLAEQLRSAAGDQDPRRNGGRSAAGVPESG